MILFNNYKTTEFELQAEIYMYFKNQGLQVRGEITDTSIRNKCKNKKGFKQCRFDIVIFKNNIAIAIIEVKKPGKNYTLNTRQYQKYSLYNLPLYYISSEEEILFIYNKIKELL